jgi:hypothetical protein
VETIVQDLDIDALIARHHQIGDEQLGKGHFMNLEVAAFLDSVTAGNPPAKAIPLLRSVWHGLRGEWEAAHQVTQDDTTAEGAWVHAWLHRIEGDSANARDWYRLAQRNVVEGDLREEGRTIAAFLLKR